MISKLLQFRNKCTLVIVAGFTVIFSLIFAVLMIAHSVFSSIDEKFKQVVNEHSQHVVLANKMIYLARERTMLLHKMVTTDDLFERDAQFIKVREAGAEFIRARQKLLSLNPLDKELGLLQQQGEYTAVARGLQDRIIELSQQGDQAEARDLLINKAIVAQDKVINILLQFADLQYQHNQQALDEYELAYDDALKLIVILVLLAISVSLFVVIFVVRKIAAINENIRFSGERLAITNRILNESMEDLSRVTDELRKSESHERAIRENMLDAVVTINAEGVMQSCNPAAEKMFGYSAEEMLGSNISMLMPEPHRSHHGKYVEAFKQGQRDKVIGMVRDLEGQHRDGHVFPMDIGVTRLLIDDELILVGIMRDITVRKQAEEALKRSHDELEHLVAQRTRELQDANKQLEQMASYDSLTALPNRSLMYEYLKQMIAHARRSKQPLAVLFLDLDGFKQVNDVFGHDAGDLLLKEVASRMKSCLRAEDVVARIGGDEFIVISAHLQDTQNAEDFAIRIINAVGQPVDMHGSQATVGVSIGISCFPGDSENMDELISFADQAMYQAKKAGKNTFCFYS